MLVLACEPFSSSGDSVAAKSNRHADARMGVGNNRLLSSTSDSDLLSDHFSTDECRPLVKALIKLPGSFARMMLI